MGRSGPDLNSLLAVQKVNHEPEVHPLPCSDSQPVSQAAALLWARLLGALAALAQGRVWVPFCSHRAVPRGREPGAGSCFGFEVGFQLLSV